MQMNNHYGPKGKVWNLRSFLYIVFTSEECTVLDDTIQLCQICNSFIANLFKMRYMQKLFPSTM